jgi:hypothetical protein
MAFIITKPIELATGITVNNCYARIDRIMGNKESMSLIINYYISQEAHLSGKIHVKQDTTHVFAASIESISPNFIKQGYEYLKTIPEFVDAIDA